MNIRIFFEGSLLKLLFLFILGMGLFCWSGNMEIIQKEVVIDWDGIRKTLENYEARPTEENARLLLEMIPEGSPSRQIGNRDKAMYSIDGSLLFHKNVIAGNECLAEAAFRLYCVVLPGGILELLEYILAEMLKTKPELYLKLLKKYKDRFDYRGFPLFMILQVDELEEDRRVYMDRIRALESVKDPDYAELRDECIRMLREVIEEYFEENLLSLKRSSV